MTTFVVDFGCWNWARRLADQGGQETFFGDQETLLDEGDFKELLEGRSFGQEMSWHLPCLVGHQLEDIGVTDAVAVTISFYR